MQRYLAIGAALLIIVGAAIVQGMWSERWSQFPELQLFADRVNNVPLEIGTWKGEELPPTDAKVLKMAGAVGSLSRTYTNPAGEQVSIFIVCGRLGDVFYHTPDRCYPSQGFEMMKEKSRERLETGDTTSEFYTTEFQKSDVNGAHAQRIYWTWSAHGAWEAPEHEKVAFAGQRALFKLYVVTPITRRGDSSDTRDPATDFIRVLIPELNKAFFPDQATPVASTADVAAEKS